MKKGNRVKNDDELRPEYDLRALRVVALGPALAALKRSGIPSMAALRAQGKKVIVLDADVAKEFRNAKDVNETLRAVLGIIQRRNNRPPSKSD